MAPGAERKMKKAGRKQDEGEAAPEVEAAAPAEATETVAAAEGSGEAETGAPAVNGMDGWKGFCSAFNSIMGRSMETPEQPVLAETDASEKIKERKADYKEKKLQSAANKAAKSRGHCLPDITKKAFDMQMRKVATSGVVRLFNAVKDFQQRGMDDVDASTAKEVKSLPVKQRAKRIAEATKGKFEEILQTERKPKARRVAKEDAEPATKGLNELDEFA